MERVSLHGRTRTTECDVVVVQVADSMHAGRVYKIGKADLGPSGTMLSSQSIHAENNPLESIRGVIEHHSYPCKRLKTSIPWQPVHLLES
jgi:hypothetical protein